MLGIIIGVAAVITSMAIGSGARAAVIAQLARLGSNLIVIVPGNVITGGVSLGSGARQSLKLGDATAIQQSIPSISAVAALSSINAQVVAGGTNWATSILGTTPSWLQVQTWTLATGRFFDDNDVRAADKVAVLGQTVATNLFPGTNPVGQMIVIRTVPFRVIGVLQSKGQTGFGRDQDDQVVIPLSALQIRLSGANWLNSIMISGKSSDTLDSIIASTEALLRLRHRLTARQPDDFSVRNIANVQAAANETSRVQSLLLAGVAAVSLIVGGIGIMNIMLVSVTERTREIGIRLAVGAKERDVLMQFLVEAIVLACIGGVVGIGIGLLASLLTSTLAGWTVIVSPISILLSFGFSALVGIVFGFYPARRASLLNPIEALRHE
ncbi:MAG: multidrug ABC transporter substrate-binding protein [Candidatus Eremiobacter antarcticus]|nr:ABC transporter permease [Candidatus Eremiobacteraeota bacterium]PZR60919.1 MAG: multidrug ABC transporter substrate-binding protein [Candidatus Eremiobacter sp. RRmetagenome_bin22]